MIIRFLLMKDETKTHANQICLRLLTKVGGISHLAQMLRLEWWVGSGGLGYISGFLPLEP